MKGSRKTSFSSRRGFTLLEVLVAVAILSVVATSLLVIRNSSVAQAADAYNLRTAATLAAQKMGEIDIAEDILGTQGSGEFSDHPGFEYYIEVAETALEKGAGALSELSVKEVRLTITYPTTTGKSQFQYVSIFPPPIELKIEKMEEEETIPTDIKDELDKLGIPLPSNLDLDAK